MWQTGEQEEYTCKIAPRSLVIGGCTSVTDTHPPDGNINLYIHMHVCVHANSATEKDDVCQQFRLGAKFLIRL